MGCLSVTLTRIGGIEAGAERIGGLTCEISMVGFANAFFSRIGGVEANAERIGGMKCQFSIVCSSGLMPPYLEIAPEILWIWTDPGYNDVYSNTTWNIN